MEIKLGFFFFLFLPGSDLLHQCLLSLDGLSLPLSWWKEKFKEERSKEKNDWKPSSCQVWVLFFYECHPQK